MKKTLSDKIICSFCGKGFNTKTERAEHQVKDNCVNLFKRIEDLK